MLLFHGISYMVLKEVRTQGNSEAAELVHALGMGSTCSSTESGFCCFVK